MKEIYNKYIKFLERLPAINFYLKMYVAENYALFTKRNLTSKVKWTNEERDAFEGFWKKNYKKIGNKGSKLIQSFNNAFNEKYIPDFLYATKIESNLNEFNYASIYSDKALTEVLYKDRSCAILPKTFLLKSHGVFYNSERKIVSLQEAKEILSSLSEAVIKPTRGGNSGKGVLVCSFNKNGIDESSKFNVFELLEKNKDNFIVQEKIIQSPELSKLYSNAINTFRIITYIANDRVNISPISLRLGAGGKKVDNIHAGGIVVGIDRKKHTLKENGYQLNYSNNSKKFKHHPDTKVEFLDFKITGLHNVLESAQILHQNTPNVKIISWDFTINSQYEAVLIEANYLGQSMWFPQIVNQEAVFNDDYMEILKNIK